MKKNHSLTITAILAMAFILASQSVYADFEADLNKIKQSGEGNYTITLTEDVLLENSISFGEGKKTVTIKGDSQMRTITRFGGDFVMLKITSNVTVILENNVTFNGNLRETQVVEVNDGKFEMRDGVVTKGGKSAVAIFGNGVFNMSGGAISDNKGRGVYVSSGAFRMTGGIISGNTDKEGGGVYVYGGTFRMTGGTISGNTANYGGGVFILVYGSFAKMGGTIDDTNSAENGKVVCYGYYTIDNHEVRITKKRNTAAGTSVNMDSGVDGSQGGWE